MATFHITDKKVHDTTPTKYTNLFLRYLYYNNVPFLHVSVHKGPPSGNPTKAIQHYPNYSLLCTDEVV